MVLYLPVVDKTAISLCVVLHESQASPFPLLSTTRMYSRHPRLMTRVLKGAQRVAGRAVRWPFAFVRCVVLHESQTSQAT